MSIVDGNYRQISDDIQIEEFKEYNQQDKDDDYLQNRN